MGLSKKIRFEVFKRDSFTCQYCGEKAPDVVLEADHIHPRAEGGDDDLLNLVTSCRDCNRGKGARKLGDETVAAKRHAQMKEIQERREQIQMMADWHKALVGETDMEAQAVGDMLSDLSGDKWALNETGLKTARGWIRRFGLGEVFAACRIAADTYFCHEDGEVTEESFEHAIQKIGGICFNRKRQKENPEEAQAAREGWAFVRAYRECSHYPENWKLFEWWREARQLTSLAPEEAVRLIREEYKGTDHGSYWTAAECVLDDLKEEG